MINTGKPLRVLLVLLAHPKWGQSEIDHYVTELWNLLQSMGGAEVMDLIVQKGPEFDATYIGAGKAEEIGTYLKDTPVDVIIFSGQLKPGQKFNLTKMYWDFLPNIRVWDRIDLILAIFTRHAHTSEAKLQIDLARMRHMGPSIFGMGMVLSRQGGGVGTRGIGETNTERMKRHWKQEMKRVTDALSKLLEKHERQIEERKNRGLATVSLVGYTNAGKTSLFNLLTHKKNLVEDAFFATLDSAVGEVYMPVLGHTIIVSDTIGFIRDLPPNLIDAFKSTLLESVSADTVLHVIDASDPDMYEKMDVVSTILAELKIPDEKVVLVYNKIDIAPQIDKQRIMNESQPYPYVFISTKTSVGIDSLLSVLSKRIQ